MDCKYCKKEMDLAGNYCGDPVMWCPACGALATKQHNHGNAVESIWTWKRARWRIHTE